MEHSMLGPHINWKGDQVSWLARAKPRVGKVLLQNVDPSWMMAARDASPDTFWVGRIVVPQPLENPQADAQRFTDTLLALAEPYRGIIHALEGYNEVGGDTESKIREFAAFERMRTEMCHAAGWPTVVGNFSTGTPKLHLWPYFEEALVQGDYLGLHEYDAPDMRRLDTWLCRRYRQVYEALPQALRLPLIITECGIDGGVLGQTQAGWKRYTDEAGYMAELEWYDRSLQADAQRFPIVGATIFCYGHVSREWESFDISGEMANVLAAYMAANPPLPWQIEGPPPPPPPPAQDSLAGVLASEFGAEFDDIRAVLTQTGQYDERPLSGINYSVIHHTGTGTTPQTYSDVIAKYHVESNGWPAIGYHFLVYDHKVRYVGSLDTSRANVWGRNPEVIGIALVGDYQDGRPSDSMLSLARRLCNVLDEYLGHALPRVGHRDVALPGHGTECPGDPAHGFDGWLQAIQVQPAPPPPPPSELEQLRARVADLEAQVASLQAEAEWLYDKIDKIRDIVSPTTHLPRLGG